MSKINLYDSILSPLVTEKSTNLSEINKKTILQKNKIVEKQDKKPEKMSITKEKITTKVEQKKEEIQKKVEKKDIKSE